MDFLNEKGLTSQYIWYNNFFADLYPCSLLPHHRHPKTSSRPSFTTLVQIFSQAEADLLIWSEDDLSVHSQVSVLGAPLEAAKDLYPQLQTLYAVSESEQGH